MTFDANQAMQQAARRSAEACNEQGIALVRQGRIEDAVAAFRRAIALDPRWADAHNNLGNAQVEANRPDEALESFQTALQLKADSVAGYNGLGMALVQKGRLSEAIAALRRAVQLNPGLAEAHNNLGNALKENGEVAQSLAALDRAVQLRPDFAGARHNRALALLLAGDFERGLPEFEWRSKAMRQYVFMAEDFRQPQWTGSPLQGRTIFLHAEQGFGDTIQFVRYLPQVIERGGRVVLGCQRELLRLFRGGPHVERIVTPGEALPDFDLHCPLASLPLAFNTRLDSIPAGVPYLTPSAELVEALRKRLGPSDGRLRVGIAWAGNPQFKADRTRSMQLSQLAPLAELKNVSFYSLQKGAAASQPGMDLIDLGKDMTDFADTAAVMSLLDLVISTDTSVPHLAGALGRPVWVMLQYSPDWRWLLDREDSPWYPTMRLLRQKSPGDWNGVVARVAGALRDREV